MSSRSNGVRYCVLSSVMSSRVIPSPAVSAALTCSWVIPEFGCSRKRRSTSRATSSAFSPAREKSTKNSLVFGVSDRRTGGDVSGLRGPRVPGPLRPTVSTTTAWSAARTSSPFRQRRSVDASVSCCRRRSLRSPRPSGRPSISSDARPRPPVRTSGARHVPGYARRMKETVERESKLTPGKGFVLPELGEPQPTRVFVSTYHDTGDLVLARHGVTLRHRVEDGTGLWQLKLPRGAARAELEQLGPPAR